MQKDKAKLHICCFLLRKKLLMYRRKYKLLNEKDFRSFANKKKEDVRPFTFYPMLHVT